MRFQRITQTVNLTLFLALLLVAGHFLPEGFAPDLFLRFDPLVAVGTAVASREVLIALLPGLVVCLAGLLVGRVFCGHICPMGTSLDLLEGPLKRSRTGTTKQNAYEDSFRTRIWKYLVLGAILAAGVGGVSLVFLGSPLSLVTRLWGLIAYPVVLMLGEWGLRGAAPVLSHVPALAYTHLGEKVFATNFFVVALFAGMIAAAGSAPRFWCRNLCPAGALIALCSRAPVIRRQVTDACNGCGRCIRECPTGAISKTPLSTVHAECIVCLHCTKICPQSAISFGSALRSRDTDVRPIDPSRRQVVWGAITGIFTAGLLRTNIHHSRAEARERPLLHGELIRPPGSVPEPDFLNRCIRCGECMAACPTNTLQPTWLQAGLEGIFSPVMTPRLGACAVSCSTCGQVCPTQAIRSLPLFEKRHAKVGTAWIDRESCLVWGRDRKCLVCDEVCPYSAISMRPVPDHLNAAPFVVAEKCIGCGWCENKCPVEGNSAIRINVRGEIRLGTGSYEEKAAEYGLDLKVRDKSGFNPAPGTFDAPASEVEGSPKSPPPEPESGGLPPGFDPK